MTTPPIVEALMVVRPQVSSSPVEVSPIASAVPTATNVGTQLPFTGAPAKTEAGLAAALMALGATVLSMGRRKQKAS